MKWKTLITMFVAAVLLAPGGIAHALQLTMPNGTKTEGQVVGNKLMLQSGPGKTTPASDGIYKMGDGKQVVVRGGLIAPAGGTAGKPAAARGGMMMDKPGDKPTPPKPDKKGQTMKPGMAGPAATRGGVMMGQDIKGPNKPEKGPGKPDKKNQMMPSSMGSPASTRGGWVMESDKPTKPDESDQGPPPKPDKKNQMMAEPATPLAHGIQGPSRATPMPQGTHGSTLPLGSPKDPMGTGGGSRPGGGPPPPLTR